jgi:hypothetical protein
MTPEIRALADALETIMPRVRITELLHEVNRATGFVSAFTNLRTGERCEDERALLAAIWPTPPISASAAWPRRVTASPATN